MSEPAPTKKEIVGLVQAQANSIDDISKRLVKIETLIEKQDSRNQNIIIGVVVAFIFIVGTVAIQVLLSNKSNDEFYSELERNSYQQNLKVQELSNKVENLRIRNPYLK